MESDTAGFTLPPAPGGLCFDRNDFVKTNFSVDNFLAEHQNVSSLETMRDDLGAYLKVLRLAMIELINKDYANFVNLSATLIGFDKAITKIQTPLTQLNGEVLEGTVKCKKNGAYNLLFKKYDQWIKLWCIFIRGFNPPHTRWGITDPRPEQILQTYFLPGMRRSVKQCLEDAMKELSMWLNQRHGLHKKKQLLRYYSQTINSLSTLDNILQVISNKKKHEQIALADRASMQYNQLKFSISKCNTLLKADQKAQFNNIGGKLIQHLNDLLFQFWNENDEGNMLKALLILSTLDKVTETEMLVRKQAIAPLLQDIISEPALQRSKEGLQGIYERILALLDTKLKLLHSVMEHSKMSFLVKQYRFLVNCFWCEVESRLEVNLSSIFAPGNPKIFYRRYNESVQFVRKLEAYCVDQAMVKLLHDTAEYKSFQRRWNLPVYFQIRFQEIAGGFEATLQSAPTKEDHDGLVLKETYSCWHAMQQCWADGIYIEALAHKFWKLSLQLLSRYTTWSCTVCSQRAPKLEPTSVNRTLIDNSITIYIDNQALLERLPQFLQSVEQKLPCQNKDLLRQSLKLTEEGLQETKHKIRESIVNELFDYFNVQLKQVSDIPRLYRKTNRSVPTKPCTYIDVVSREIKQFNEDGRRRLDNAFMQEVFEALFNVMTESYYKYVEDVLTSVQKTEESLRRLKQIREKTTQQPESGTTDGEKIRLQLNVDVVSYGALARTVHVDPNNMHKYKELSAMVTDAVKSIDIK